MWREQPCHSRVRRFVGECGAAAVEFALVVVFLMVVLAGAIDVAALFQARREANDAARAGARAAAQACIADASCTLGNPNDADNRVQAAIADIVGIRTDRVRKIIVYRASSASAEVPADCLTSATGVAGLCNVTMDPYLVDGSFRPMNVIAWPSSTRQRSDATADYIGVHLAYRYNAPLGILGRTKTLGVHAAFRLEPPILASTALEPLPVINALDPTDTDWWQDYVSPCTSDCDDDGDPGPPIDDGNGAG